MSKHIRTIKSTKFNLEEAHEIFGNRNGKKVRGLPAFEFVSLDKTSWIGPLSFLRSEEFQQECVM